MSVLDASVILKWFVSEKDSDKAEIVRKEYYVGKREIIVPDLILYEISNALRYHPEFETIEIQEAIQTIFDIDIEIITPTQMLINKSINIARENDVTCYDASYLTLAQDLKTDFITADEKFYNRISKDVFPNIILLKDT